jgi:hypothetical protein
MSKTSKSRLTGSGRKRVRPARAPRRPQSKRQPAWLDTLDAVNERCNRIETLAGLLRACEEPEEMNARLAARAGGFIADDLRQVKELLDGLQKETP